MGAYGNTEEAPKNPSSEPEPGDVILWDTNALYDWKDPFYDAVDLHVKIGDGFGSKNEIYKVYDTGLRDFGRGAMWTNRMCSIKSGKS